MKCWIAVIVAIALMGLHEKLSEAKHWFLGATLPLACIGMAVYEFGILKENSKAAYRIDYIVIFGVSIALWAVVQHRYKQKELDKLKAIDINGAAIGPNDEKERR